jgi:DNA-binding transcriptional LysR family regulator
MKISILDLVHRRVSSTRYILCASPSYIEKNGMPKTPQELSQHFYITHSMRKPNNVVTFKNEEKITLEPKLKLNDSFAMRESAILGLGIIKVHDYIVTDALKDGRLVELLQEYQEPEQSIFLYYQSGRYLLPKIRRFIDFFV